MSIIKSLYEKGTISEDEVISHLHGAAKRKLDGIKLVVDCKLNAHQMEFLRMLVEWLAKYKEHLTEIEKKIEVKAYQFNDVIEIVCTTPCIERTSAIIIISEIGAELTKFKTAGHLCSWAGMCPGNNESAGKKKSTKVNKGNNFIKNVLCQCSWAITRHRKSFLHNWYWKIKQRRGCKKAIVALGRKLLTIIYNLITKKELFNEEHYNNTMQKQEELRKKRLMFEARKLGFELIKA